MGFQDSMRVSRPTLAAAEQLLASSDEPYHQLAVVLGFLRHLYLLHQTNHWSASGDPFYGDHLLFQRLYEGVAGEIDGIAEKAVGLGSPHLVNLTDQLQLVNVINQTSHRHFVIPRPDELVDLSLCAESTFVEVMKNVYLSLENCGYMTKGLDNLLAGILDKHEGNIYLLKQRAVTTFSV